MKQDRTELEIVLDRCLSKYSAFTNKIIDPLVRKNGIPRGRITGIINKSILLSLATDIELCLLTMELYNVTNENELIPDKWFNTLEISNAERYTNINTEDDTDILVIENVTKISDCQYVAPAISYKEIARMYNGGFINYNERTQRETIKRIFNGKIIESPNIIPKKVKEIKKILENGKPITNIITLNIRKTTGLENFEYDSRNKLLKIKPDNETTFLDLLDSAHRSIALVLLMNEKPSFEGNMVLSIYNYTEEEAQEWVSINDRQTPISQIKIATMNPDDSNMLIAKDINKFGNNQCNELYSKLAEELIEVETSEKYVTLFTLAQAIKANFIIDKPIEIVQIKKFLIDGFNYIIGSYSADFENRKASQLVSIKTLNNMFIGYAAILAQLYKDSNWMDKLDNILNNIDLSKSTENELLWKNIGMYSKKVNKSVVSKISNYFKEVMKI